MSACSLALVLEDLVQGGFNHRVLTHQFLAIQVEDSHDNLLHLAQVTFPYLFIDLPPLSLRSEWRVGLSILAVGANLSQICFEVVRRHYLRCFSSQLSNRIVKEGGGDLRGFRIASDVVEIFYFYRLRMEELANHWKL